MPIVQTCLRLSILSEDTAGSSLKSDKDRRKALVTCVSKLMSKDIHEQEQTADERKRKG